MCSALPVLMAVSSFTPKKPLHTFTFSGRFLEYLIINSLSESSSMAEWEELTERTLEDLERRWLAGGGEGRGREGRVGGGE